MPRRSKAADETPATADPAPPPRSATSNSAGKKRKIDWSTVDDFDGFTLTSVSVKTQKKSSKPASKKQRTGAQASGSRNYPGQDAPLDANVDQPNPFPEADLSEVHMKVAPVLYWESTNRYRKFTSKQQSCSSNHAVLIQASQL